ncbi:BCS1 N terminal-domain-containing protein [Pleurostoma richardsiae]|uniref:BCS1 N terminal-domain-containing protein n=1 Tax=Pleurostoma richardsiae TaxID=41990 RepID=A0AA38VD64_9PEZI|nr:BCS1 N terminal-domain-containing protein [Pleurostoma richardsiae]
MDFKSVITGAMPSFGSNMTSTAVNGSRVRLPEGLENLIPLLGSRNPLVQIFMVLYQMIGRHTGLDPTALLTVFGFIWAANKLGRQIYHNLYGLVSTYMMSNVHISSSDEIYLHMMKWLALQPKMVNSRSLMAETPTKTAWEDEDDSNVLETRISADGAGVYLNFSNQEAKSPPRFVPAMGLHSFWHQGTYFRLQRKQESFLDDGGNGIQAFKDKEDLVISCLGRSPEPIKRLLQHAKQMYFTDHYARTTIKRPSPQNMRRYGGRHSWVQVANRPVRPMKTVVLDAKQKVQVLADINEYLHPATPRWYANRGIPLRRGYLFHGPPGTGKTSLSFALAGVFGLDIYVISLLEPTLTEEDLSALFNTLPRRCVVLLEDIDTAGLSRPAAEGADGGIDGKKGAGGGGAGGDKGGHPNDWKVSDLARELKKQGGSSPDDKKGISLSGLLNAIDGVASHEGRVLIMTTNKPEALDEALIRPGRVDLQVAFTSATRDQARELFERMYEADSHQRAPALGKPAAAANGSAAAGEKGDANGRAGEGGEKAGWAGPEEDLGDDDGNDANSDELETSAEALLGDDERLDMSAAELRHIAGEFADRIPDMQFSPAEIQGFLLKRKKNPRRALAEVDAWVDAMVQAKESKTKVQQVQ